MRLELLSDEGRLQTAGQATFGMSNLHTDSTGLPFIVFISQRDDARHAARVKWSPQPKVKAEALGSYAISPFAHKAGPRLGGREESLLEGWIDLNRETLQRYWDGDLEYTQDAVAQLRKL